MAVQQTVKKTVINMDMQITLHMDVVGMPMSRPWG